MKNLRFLVLAAIAIAALLAMFLLPLEQWILALAAWIRNAGWQGVALFAGAYILGAVLLAPGSVLTLAAGFAYGPLLGTLLVSPVSVLAATAAFFIGRYTARDWVARKVSTHENFAAIDRAIAHNGFKVVLLLRLSPIFPFNLLNYALGLTGVRARSYVGASLLGMLPGTFLYVYLGSLITNAAQLTEGGREGGVAGQVLFWGGLVATVAVTLLISRLATKELNAVLAAAPAKEGQS
jgi:uncharacterized membrane protein YdjX (TVP38/TMEM64 family)